MVSGAFVFWGHFFIFRKLLHAGVMPTWSKRSAPFTSPESLKIIGSLILTRLPIKLHIIRRFANYFT